MRRRRVLLLAAAAALLAVPAAHANGDPASDALLVDQVFLPADAPVPDSDREALIQTVKNANERGYPIRVALIPFTSDLGTAISLWRHPQDYAKFLASELSFVYPKRVLIVQPSGFGVYNHGKPVAKEQRVLARVPLAAGTPGQLAQSTVAAVRALAAADGVTVPEPSTGGGQDWRDRAIIAVGGLFVVGLILFVGRRLGRGRRSRPQPEQ
jgi:hypothetical protein